MATDILKGCSSNGVSYFVRPSTKEKSVGVTEMELASYNRAMSASAKQLLSARDLFNRNCAPALQNYLPLLSSKSKSLCTHGDLPESVSSSPVSVSATGIITLILNDRIRVDITADKAIRVFNGRNSIVMAVSATGSTAAFIHPNGRVFQYGSRVEILAKDNGIQKNSKYAKMWHKGISFTSDRCPLVYLVDAAGTRTTTSKFCDLNYDFTLAVFLSDSGHGPEMVPEAKRLIKTMRSFAELDGTRNWVINGLRISQTIDGLVRVSRGNRLLLRTSSSNGSASLISPFLHCTGSKGPNSHLFVRRGERRMHYDGKNFTVRNAGHSAGFDELSQLKVY